jgi:hypothetical protein
VCGPVHMLCKARHPQNSVPYMPSTGRYAQSTAQCTVLLAARQRVVQT